MHVSEAEALVSHSRMSPVKSSAYHSLPGTEASTPRSEVREPRTSTLGISDLGVFDFSLVKSTIKATPADDVRLPSYSLAQTRPQPQQETHLKASDLSFGGVKSNHQLRYSGDLRSQRDSVFRSSLSSVHDNGCPHGNKNLSDQDSDAVGKCEHVNADLEAQQWDFPSLGSTAFAFPYTPPTDVGEDTAAEAGYTLEPANNKRASSDCADSSLKETWNLERPFTSSLGVPHQWPHSVSPKLSIISDAGDQQQLRLKRTLAQPEESFDENYDIEQSLASLPPLGPTHELQEQILDARQRTRNNEGQIRKFIPKEDLCRVVNTDSVTRALMKELSQVHSHEQIRSYAKVICTELETNEIQRGKAKIKSFRKIFALLVLVEAASSIVRFLDEDVSDQDLPLTLVRRQGTDELYRKGNRNKKPLRCFKLSPVKLENFQEYQWWMLAPYFSPGEDGVMKHYILQDDHILPFVDPDDADEGGVVIKTGGYGRVLMVRIHPDHHNFRDRQLCERGFAIKQQIYDSDRDTFKREVRVLKEFSGDRSHPHVVSLLATYEQFRKFHLIFYRAEGDLFDHWKKMKPRPDLTYSNVVWVATQCTGIAEGLLKLHKLLSFHKVQAEMVESQSEDNNITADQSAVSTEKRVRIIEPIHDRVGTDSSILSNGVKERAASPIKWPNQKDGHRFDSNEDARCKQYGRHGDINPANILWYNGNDDDAGCLQGTLKIADFGQAELNSLLSRTKRRSVANTLTYRPPECDLPSSIIRQSYDIWCLGCVYLEFVTWLLGGEQLLMKFVRLRMAPDVFQQGQLSDTFFQAVRNHETFPPEIEIKPKVTQFIDDLHRNPKCTVYLHEFLNMIQNDMLVVESSERKQCASIWNRLDSMTRKCHQDEDYAATYNPWYFKQTSVSRSVELKMTPDVRQAIEKNLPLRPATPARAGPVSSHAPEVQPIPLRRRRPSRIPRRSCR